MHELHEEISEELGDLYVITSPSQPGDRAGVATACGNLGICYRSTGDCGRAREMHEQQKAICEELGDHAGVVRACGNLENCLTARGTTGGRVRSWAWAARAMQARGALPSYELPLIIWGTRT